MCTQHVAATLQQALLTSGVLMASNSSCPHTALSAHAEPSAAVPSALRRCGISTTAPGFAALKPVTVRPGLCRQLLHIEGFELAYGQQMRHGLGITANPAGLYDMMHSYLASAGVDGVKVDVQGFVQAVGRGASLPNVSDLRFMSPTCDQA